MQEASSPAETAVDEEKQAVLAGEIISKSLSQPSPLLFMLHELQDTFGSISETNISQISEALNTPMPEILAIVTFHKQFKLNMGGEAALVARNTIRVCSGAPCHVKGSQTIMDKIAELLEIQAGEVTKDQRFAFEVVDCLGACGVSPVMMINDDIHGNLTTDKLPDIFNNYK